MIVYVERDTKNAIKGVYASPQPGYATEAIDDGDAEVQAFRNPVIDLSALDTATINAALVQPGSIVRALGLVTFQEINKLRVLAGQQSYTMAQFMAAIKANIR